MRDDYYYNGVPIRRMTNEQIVSCLACGIEINDSQGEARPTEELERAVMKRLRLELDIRHLSL